MPRKLRDLFNSRTTVIPESPDELFARAQDLKRQGQTTAAAEGLRRILDLHPDHWESLNALAVITLDSGDLETAIQLYDMVIDRRPDQAGSYYKRGNAWNRLGRPEPALIDYDRAIQLDPSHSRALCNRGAVLERLGRREEALESYDRALAVDPMDLLTHYNRGSVLKDLKRFEEALSSYDRAVDRDANFTEAFINRGNVLAQLRRYEAASASFGRAIELNPVYAEAFHGRAAVLYRLKRLAPALADYDKAIALKPDFATLYADRGNLLLDWQRYDEAVASYLKAIELRPTEFEAHFGLAQSYVRLKKLDRAIASFDQAMMLDSNRNFLPGLRSAAKMQACDWDTWATDQRMIIQGIEAGRAVCNPMTLAALLDSPMLHRSAARIWVQQEAPSDDALGAISFRPPHARVRIGYFSADFCMHPVAFLAAGLFERHDRSKFEITAFAFGARQGDPMTTRLRRAFDRFIDVRERSDLDVAALARDLQIDVAVDLNGITEQCRSKIFALRAAPIQINYLGYPGTMGAQYMDYLVADRTVVPPAMRTQYDEKIIYLPDCFLPFDSSYAIADRTFTREELGLPADGFVFCCFCNTSKITPPIFDAWMRILTRVDKSVLWLSPTNASAAEKLVKEASRRSVDPQRLKFAAHLTSLPEHLARIKAADLFLDTFPYNAHATALDALWAGLPVLTCEGQGFASRVASSLLRTAGLPQLVTKSISQYEATAIRLAEDLEPLSQLRTALQRNRSTTALFDTTRYTRNLETAYERIHERHHAGVPPSDIDERSAG
jgi:protein O-GlcNAc transferase